MPKQNFYANLPSDLSEEAFEAIEATDSVRIERIVSRGHATPEGEWYDQERNEWVMVVQGSAGLRFEGEEPVELRPGDHVTIPARARHRVEWTEPGRVTLWVAVFH